MPKFQVITAPKTDLLLEFLARKFHDRKTPPLKPEYLLGPSPRSPLMAYVTEKLAAHNGVLVNYRNMLLSVFLWDLYARLCAHCPRERLLTLDVQTLTFMLLGKKELILNSAPEDGFALLKNYLTADEATDERAVELCFALATVYERYQALRPDYIISWSEFSGNLTTLKQQAEAFIKTQPLQEQQVLEQNLYQILLWALCVPELKAKFHYLDRACAFRELIKLLEEAPAGSLNVPERIFILGEYNYTPQIMQVLEALSRHTEVNLLYVAAQDAQGTAAASSLQESFSHADKVFFRMLPEKVGMLRLTEHGSLQPDSTLEYLQGYLTGRSDSARPFAIPKDDLSFQVHACHTIRREGQVLKDQLLSAFTRERGRLQPHRVAVLLCDPHGYSCDLSAVFGLAGEILPVSLTEIREIKTCQELEAIDQLLSLNERRFTLKLLFELLNYRSIAASYQLSAEDLQALKVLCSRASIFHDLKEDELVPEATWTLKCGVTRLIESYLMGSDEQEPLLNLPEGSLELIGKLSQLSEDLLHFAAKLEHRFSCEQFRELMAELMATFMRGLDGELKAELTVLINTLLEPGCRLFLNTKLTFSVKELRTLLRRMLEGHSFVSCYNQHCLNFTEFTRCRDLPVDYVFMLGANDDTLPAKKPRLECDLTAALPRATDYASDDAERAALLSALLNAQKGFYCSYLGEDPVNRKQRNPSLLISDLLNFASTHLTVDSGSLTAAQSHKNTNAVKRRLWVQEALNSYDLRNYQERSAPLLPQTPSYDSYAYAGAPKEAASPSSHSQLQALRSPVPEHLILNLKELIYTLTHPCKTFLQQALGVRLQLEQEEEVSSEEYFALPHFEAAELIREAVLSDKSIAELCSAEGYASMRLKGFKQHPHLLSLQLTQNQDVICTMQELRRQWLTEHQSLLSSLTEQPYAFTVSLPKPDSQEQCTITLQASFKSPDDLLELWPYSNKFSNPQLKLNCALKSALLSHPAVEISSRLREDLQSFNAAMLNTAAIQESSLPCERRGDFLEQILSVYLDCLHLGLPLNRPVLKHISDPANAHKSLVPYGANPREAAQAEQDPECSFIFNDEELTALLQDDKTEQYAAVDRFRHIFADYLGK